MGLLDWMDSIGDRVNGQVRDTLRPVNDAIGNRVNRQVRETFGLSSSARNAGRERVKFEPADTSLRDRFVGRNLPSRAETDRAKALMPKSFGELVGPSTGTQTASISQQLQRIDQDFNAQRNQLRSMFQLAESSEEKARIAFVLGDLEEQRKAATTIIADQYTGAQQFANAQAGQMREAAVDDGQAMQSMYADAAESAGAGIEAIASEYEGTGLGLGAVPVDGDATDWIGLIESQGAAQGALQQQMGSIAAEDQAYLATQLGTEGGAQQGEAQRAAMWMRADSIARHQQAVNERVAAERSQMNAALADLEAMRLSQRASLQDRQFDVDRGYEQDRRDWLLGQEQARLDRVASQAPAGPSVPTNPQEQVLFLGQLMSQDPAAGMQMIQALLAQGAISPQIAAAFLPAGS